MDLKEFKKMYIELEEKCLKIMEIYNLGGDYTFNGFSIDEYSDKTKFCFDAMGHYRGCDPDVINFEFDLDEMNNDLEYFRNKYSETVEREKIAKELMEQKKIEERKRLKDEKDKLDYERLKLKFGESN